MYKDYFGLERGLFDDGIAQDAGVFFSEPAKLTAARLTTALTLRDSVAVLAGPAGVGKTTIAAHTLRATATRLALGWLGSAPLTSHELLEMLLTEFGFSPYKHSRVERLQMWRQFLGEMCVTSTRVCLLVENAESIAPEILATLESLTAADPNGCPGANVVLTCRSAAADLLASPQAAALKQRTRLQKRLEPLSRDDMRRYLEHRVVAAKGAFDAIFADGAVDAIHSRSGGIIRIANNLCETSLTVAAEARSRVDGALVSRVAADVFGIEVPAAPAIPAAPAARAAAAKPAPARAADAPQPEAAPAVGADVTAIRRPAPAAARPRARPDVLLEPIDEVPVLKLEDDAFDLDPAQIDEALRLDVPTLTDSVELPGPDSPVDASIRIAADAAQGQLADLDALAHARSLEDISNSMAETLFGDIELEQLAATLAVAAGAQSDEPADEETEQPAARGVSAGFR